MPNRLSIALILCLSCARMSWAEAGLLADGHLDTAAVRDAYLRADIPFVRATLEGFVKVHPHEVGTAEKVFTHLYLGAVYAGEPGGRPRAEANFRAALRLDAYSDPANLYLPPATKTWFERLRADVLRAQAEAPPAESGPAAGLPAEPAPAEPPPADEGTAQQAPPPIASGPAGIESAAQVPEPTPAFPSSSAPPFAEAAVAASPASHGWLWWTLGAAAAATGAGAFAWIETNAKPAPRHVQIDATLK